jgi:hypothetical protein
MISPGHGNDPYQTVREWREGRKGGGGNEGENEGKRRPAAAIARLRRGM